jgi:hypothetical protein
MYFDVMEKTWPLVIVRVLQAPLLTEAFMGDIQPVNSVLTGDNDEDSDDDVLTGCDG